MSSRDSVGIKAIILSPSAGRFSCLFDRHSGEVSRPQKVAQRKISNSNQRLNRPAHFARTRRLASWVMQWVCSLRDSLQGLDASAADPPYELASHFPLGAGHKGHREAPLLICNFLRVAQATLRCKSRNPLIHASFRDLLRITTGTLSRNKLPLWKVSAFCGKQPRRCANKGYRCVEKSQNDRSESDEHLGTSG